MNFLYNIKTENLFISYNKNLLISYMKSKIKAKIWAMKSGGWVREGIWLNSATYVMQYVAKVKEEGEKGGDVKNECESV